MKEKKGKLNSKNKLFFCLSIKKEYLIGILRTKTLIIINNSFFFLRRTKKKHVYPLTTTKS